MQRVASQPTFLGDSINKRIIGDVGIGLCISD